MNGRRHWSGQTRWGDWEMAGALAGLLAGAILVSALMGLFA